MYKSLVIIYLLVMELIIYFMRKYKMMKYGIYIINSHIQIILNINENSILRFINIHYTWSHFS